MNCHEVRENLSAALDGEAETGSEQALLGHLATCADCSRGHAQAVELKTTVAAMAQLPVADRTSSIMGAIAASQARPQDAAHLGALRWALAFCALAQVVTALGSLVGLSSIGHNTNELLIFELALAVAFAAAAYRPQRAWGMLPFLAAIAGGIAVVATIDVVRGAAAMAAESSHVIELLGVGLVWLVAKGVRDTAARAVATA